MYLLKKCGSSEYVCTLEAKNLSRTKSSFDMILTTKINEALKITKIENAKIFKLLLENYYDTRFEIKEVITKTILEEK